jgi:hypothetical protein
MKTKLEYERPSMRVVEIRQHGMLMGSNPQAKMTVTYEEEDI